MTSTNPTPALTPDDLILKAEALAEKATPGPWSPVDCGSKDEPMWSVRAARIAGRRPLHEVALCATGDSPQEMETANAAFIAASRTLVPALASALREAGEKNAELVAELASHTAQPWHKHMRELETTLAAANRRIDGLVKECAKVAENYGIGNYAIAEAIRALASTPAPAQETIP